MLRARAASLGYGGDEVLTDVSLEVGAGEFWCLIGPNGSGKSTLLWALLGALEPSRGAIELNPARCSRQRIGFVPQSCEMNPSLPTTVREFVSLGLVGAAEAPEPEAQRIGAALAKVGLAGLERHDYRRLSGGQRQRALVARALVRRPDLLIADEPTTGLDLTAKTRLLEGLADLHRNDGLTILFVTHELEIASRYASHVALFHDRTVTAGRREEVMKTAAITAAYGVEDARGTDE